VEGELEGPFFDSDEPIFWALPIAIGRGSEKVFLKKTVWEREDPDEPKRSRCEREAWALRSIDAE
jgi:hypothetical protein